MQGNGKDNTGTPADLITELGKLGARDPGSARLMGMIVALAGEVFVLKAQVERLTRALADTGTVDATCLARVAAQDGMAEWLAKEEGAFARGLTAPYLAPDISINATGWMREE